MPSIEYETEDRGEVNHRVRASVRADNGEVQLRTEWYDSKSNADRGLAEIARSVLGLVSEGEIRLDRAT